MPRWSSTPTRSSINGTPFLVFEHRAQNVLEFLDVALLRWGDRIYIVQDDRRLSFNDVAEQAGAHAVALRELGLSATDAVLLLGWNSIDWIINFWAVLMAGGYVVAGNAWWSRSEAAKAVETCKPEIVITDDSTSRHGLPRQMSFSDLASRAAGLKGQTQLRQAEDTPAVALFTSGTSGIQKAAVLSHRAVIAGMHSQLALTRRLPHQLHEAAQPQVTLQTGPMFHIGGVQAIIRAPVLGGKLVLTSGRFDPEEVLQLIQRERINRWPGVVPTMALRVANHPTVDQYDLSSMKSLTLGGTVVAESVMQRVRSIFVNAHKSVHTGWGLTESGGQLTVAMGHETLERPGTVGRALPFVELRIKDPDDEGVGEVLARSPMQMTGYLGEASEEIIDDEGWLHTGDLGRLDDEGWLWLVGRNKDLIIRGGENVPVAQIEEVLVSHKDVLEVAVVGLPDDDLGEVVAAAIRLAPDAAADESELRQYAASRLASFAVPEYWSFLMTPLPTNAVGKIEKRQIRENWPMTGDTTTHD